MLENVGEYRMTYHPIMYVYLAGEFSGLSSSIENLCIVNFLKHDS